MTLENPTPNPLDNSPIGTTKSCMSRVGDLGAGEAPDRERDMASLRIRILWSTAIGLLAAAPGLAQQTVSAVAGSGTAASTGQSEDIIVTAQRRSQTLIEVPQSISVIGGDTLERQQAKNFVDFAALIPGFNVTQDFPGSSRLILRGINTGSVGSTVAVYVDDVPFGQSGSLANGAILAGDFDTFDVSRIEVLRGPQGTLYGSNSLGGVLKYVVNAPSTDKLEVRGQAGVETVRDGATGFLGNALINVPLGDTLAVRASGFYHRTPGQIDRVGLPGRDTDRANSYGGRASLLFKPTDKLSARLMAIVQNIAVDSPSAFAADPATLKPIDPVTGASTGKRQLRYERYPEFHNIDYRLYSGTLDFDAGFATLSSISSYATQKQNQISDISTNGARGLAGTVYGGANPAGVGLAFRNNASLRKYTQELRLVSSKSTFFDYVIGAYYTNEKTALAQEFLPFNFTSQALLPTAGTFGPFTFSRFVYANIEARYREIAGYANGTVHFGERFDVTLGGRYSHNSQSSTQAVIQLGNGTPVNGKSKEGVFTWSVAPRFEVNNDLAVYGRVAKGYRPGGPNFIPAGAAANFPAEFNSDTLISYEAGIKTQTADRRVSFEASGFYVDWDNILILSTASSSAGPVGVNANGKRARTYGVEATATLRPADGFEVSINGAWTRARLRDDTVTNGGPNLTGGLKGDDLPFVPRIAANVSADYRWALGNTTTAFIGGDVHVQADQKAGFSAAYRTAFGRQITLDGYSTVGLRAGADIGQLTVQVYARNLGDSRGLLNASGYPVAVPAAIGGQGINLINATSIRPRTLGATVGYKF